MTVKHPENYYLAVIMSRIDLMTDKLNLEPIKMIIEPETNVLVVGINKDRISYDFTENTYADSINFFGKRTLDDMTLEIIKDHAYNNVKDTYRKLFG